MQSLNNLVSNSATQKPFIKNLRVKNFTCFENLELTNCGRANLLLANNNCGKTNLLRAIDLVVARCKNGGFNKNTQHTELSRSIIKILKKTNSLPQLNERQLASVSNKIILKALNLFVNFYSPQNDFTIETDLNNNETTKILINFKSCCKSIQSLEISKDYDGIYPVMHSLYLETELTDYILELYELTLDLKIEDLLKTISELIVNNLTTVRGHANDLVKFFMNDTSMSTTLGWQGNGLKRMITIALLVIYNKDSAVIIDEVDNGLHYNRYEDFAKMILKSAELANTQVFITTHSREFAKVFLQTAAEFKKPDSDKTFNEDVKTYRLYKKGNGVVAADYGNATASLKEIDFNNNSFTRDV